MAARSSGTEARRRVRQRAWPLFVLVAVVLGVAAPFDQAGASPPEARVRPGDTLADLARQKDGSGEGKERARSPLEGLWSMVGWTVVALGAGVALLIFCRRLSFAGRAAGGTAVVQVVGRTALSPRHSVYLLRIAGRRLVAVGVCGDRMTTLAEIDAAEAVEELVPAATQPGLAPDQNAPPDRLEASAVPEVGRLRSWLRQARESLPPLAMGGKRCPT